MHYRVVRVAAGRPYKDMPGHYLTYDEAEEAAENLNVLELEKGRCHYVISECPDRRDLGPIKDNTLTVKRDGALTVADGNDIGRGNFSPDIKKLASELDPHLGDFNALRVFGARIVSRYGHQVCREVVHSAKIIYGGGPPILNGIWFAAVRMRKRTTKADAVAQHTDALVKLLRNQPDAIVEPILDSLLERINRGQRPRKGAQ